jgi:hypothetical protein
LAAAEERVRRIGVPLHVRRQRILADYLVMARQIGDSSDPATTIMLIGRGEGAAYVQSDFVRDCLSLAALGCSEALLAALAWGGVLAWQERGGR